MEEVRLMVEVENQWVARSQTVFMKDILKKGNIWRTNGAALEDPLSLVWLYNKYNKYKGNSDSDCWRGNWNWHFFLNIDNIGALKSQQQLTQL